MVFSNNLLMGAGGQASGFDIDQSIRFNDDDSAYLNRTPGSAGNRRTFTFSCWFKRANITSANAPIFSAGTDDWLMFLSGNTLGFNSDGSNNYRIVTTQVFRDPAAWTHLVLRVDTTNSTAGDRLRLYINGSEVTDFGTDTNPPLNYETAFNNTGEHSIGKVVGSSQFFDGYLSEINFVDGSSLGPSSFGETSSETGQWVAINYSGSYGTNGFHIDGRDSSDLGDDESGNGNDYASSGLSTADQVTDTPTDNHCVLNVLDGAGTVSNGNLVNAATGSGFVSRRATIGIPSSGKWAFRVKKSANNFMVGVMAPQATDGDPDTNGVDAVFYYDEDGTSSGDIQTRRSGSKVVETTDAPAGIAADTFMEVLIDKDNNRLGVVIGGTAYVAVDSGVAIQDTMTQIFVATAGSGVTATVDFGQSGFTPSQTGYKALSTSNLGDPSIIDPSKYFQSTTYTGNGSTQSINQSGNNTFQPDWVWIKNRDAADSHIWTDAVRGATKVLECNDADAEVTDADTLTGFESDGFALGDDDKVNTNTENYIAWQWKANGAGSSNEDGTINTTATSVNTTTGVSISTYTGTGSNATVGHGLGVAPKMVIVKRRNTSESWRVWHTAMTDGSYFLNLENTDAQYSLAAIWNSTVPTSSVVSVGTNASVNGSSDTHVMYAFADVEGFSKFGAYVGNNNNDGTFVYTGFKPAFLMFKVVSAVDSWQVYDTARQDFNVFGRSLTPNENAVESSFSARVDLLSNGFKARSTNTAINGSQTYLFMAYAETPFKTATGR
jgi:hypothetical protein